MTAKAKTQPKPKPKTKAKTKPPVDKAWHDKKKETEGTTRAYYVSIGVTFLIPAKTKAELQKKLGTDNLTDTVYKIVNDAYDNSKS